ncbi:MAG: hypothetical protein ACLFP2_01265 [Candidatus Woesearchaeota archaeon]
MPPFDARNENLENTIRIMSTNIERINQKLSISRPENDPQQPPQILEELDKRFNKLANFFKSSLDNMTQHINHFQNHFQTLAHLIKTSEDNIRKEIQEQKDKAIVEIKKEVQYQFSQSREQLKQSINTGQEKINDISRQDQATIKQELDSIKREIQDMLKRMEATQNSTKGKEISPAFKKDINEIKNKLGDRFDETLQLLWRLLEINYKLLEEKKDSDIQQ